MTEFRFAVRVTPRGGRDALEGWTADARGDRILKARVAAAPESGEANAALIRLLAATLDIAPTRIRIAKGAHSRVKIVTVDGEGVAARIEALGKNA